MTQKSFGKARKDNYFSKHNKIILKNWQIEKFKPKLLILLPKKAEASNQSSGEDERSLYMSLRETSLHMIRLLVGIEKYNYVVVVIHFKSNFLNR